MALDQLQGTLAERIGEIERPLFDVTAKLEASGDFPEEGYRFISPGEALAAIRAARGRMEALLAESRRGRLLREGITVAIAGRPNVGKSTLFNRLAGVERAIVTAVPGTTRDLITEAVMLSGVRMTLVDTAGVRSTTDPVEREGVLRAEKATAAADRGRGRPRRVGAADRGGRGFAEHDGTARAGRRLQQERSGAGVGSGATDRSVFDGGGGRRCVGLAGVGDGPQLRRGLCDVDWRSGDRRVD